MFWATPWQSTVLERRGGGVQRGCTCRVLSARPPTAEPHSPSVLRPVQGAAPSLHGRLADTEAALSAVPRAERGLILSAPK